MLPFWEAVDECKKVGAQLIGEYDDFESQLNMDGGSKVYGKVWVGTVKEDDGAYRSFRGTLSNVAWWGSGYPNGQKYAFTILDQNGGRIEFINTGNDSEPMSFICTDVFAEWQFDTLKPQITDNSQEYNETTTQYCYRSHDYDHLKCEGEPKSKLSKYLKWVTTPMSMANSIDHCRSIGGQLFGDLDGSYEQLQFLFHHLPYENINLGVTDTVQEGKWVNFRGQDVTNVALWKPGEPNDAQGQENFAFVKYNGNGLAVHDTTVFGIGKFACQMIWAELTPWTTVSEESTDPSRHLDVHQNRSCSKGSYGSPPDCVGPVTRTIRYHWITQVCRHVS